MENRMSPEFINGSDATPASESEEVKYRHARARAIFDSTQIMVQKARAATGNLDACIGRISAAGNVLMRSKLEVMAEDIREGIKADRTQEDV